MDLQCSKQTYFCIKIDNRIRNSAQTNRRQPRNSTKKILRPHSRNSVQPFLSYQISIIPPRHILASCRYIQGAQACARPISFIFRVAKILAQTSPPTLAQLTNFAMRSIYIYIVIQTAIISRLAERKILFNSSL